MKKLLTVLLPCILLTGCNVETVNNTPHKPLQNVVPTLNTQEKEMVNNFIEKVVTRGYKKTWTALAKNRKAFGQPDKKRPSNMVPFCDVIDHVLQDESGFSSKTATRLSFSSQWKQKYGVSLKEQCMNSGEFNVKPQTIDPIVVVETKEVMEAEKIDEMKEATVVVDDNLLLSPDKIRELTTTIKDCERAKQRMLTILDSSEDLTVAHYDEVIKLISQCERFKLEVELNK